MSAPPVFQRQDSYSELSRYPGVDLLRNTRVHIPAHNASSTSSSAAFDCGALKALLSSSSGTGDVDLWSLTSSDVSDLAVSISAREDAQQAKHTRQKERLALKRSIEDDTFGIAELELKAKERRKLEEDAQQSSSDSLKFDPSQSSSSSTAQPKSVSSSSSQPPELTSEQKGHVSTFHMVTGVVEAKVHVSRAFLEDAKWSVETAINQFFVLDGDHTRLASHKPPQQSQAQQPAVSGCSSVESRSRARADSNPPPPPFESSPAAFATASSAQAQHHQPDNSSHTPSQNQPQHSGQNHQQGAFMPWLDQSQPTPPAFRPGQDRPLSQQSPHSAQQGSRSSAFAHLNS